MLNDRNDKHARRWLLPLAATTIALAASTIVRAQDPVPTGNGLMTFPNVRVVNVGPPVNADAKEESSLQAPGLRAFRDPVTGKLREPTREEVEALEAAGAQRGPRLGLRTAPMPVTQLPNGAVGVQLNESYMSFSVVRRIDGNRMAEACFTGEEQALAWLRPEVRATPVNKRSIGPGELQ